MNETVRKVIRKAAAIAIALAIPITAYILGGESVRLLILIITAAILLGVFLVVAALLWMD